MHRSEVVCVAFAVACMCGPAAAWAQVAPQRGWVDVNFGVAGAAGSRFEMDASATFDGETERARAEYRLPRGADFDFGVGVMLGRQWGIGLSFSGTGHQDRVDLAVDVPHPLFFNAFASDTSFTDRPLRRVEGGASIQIMVVALERGNVRVRVFGGPTHFRVEQEAVETIRYNQTFGLFLPTNRVDIREYDAVVVEGSGWGAHIGADVNWFFPRIAGVGAMLRVMTGGVEIDNALGRGTVDVRTGDVQAGGGLRLRF